MEGPVTLHHEVPVDILEDITNRYYKPIDLMMSHHYSDLIMSLKGVGSIFSKRPKGGHKQM